MRAPVVGIALLALGACSTQFDGREQAGPYDGQWEGELRSTVQAKGCSVSPVKAEIRDDTVVGKVYYRGREIVDFGGHILKDGTFQVAWIARQAGFGSDIRFDTPDTATGTYTWKHCVGEFTFKKVSS